jgi:hypothetical protein
MVHLGRSRVAADVDFEQAEELVRAAREIVGPSKDLTFKNVGGAFRQLPVTNEAAHSVAISSLFPYARQLLGSSKTKNPAWFRKNSTLDGLLLSRDETFKTWLSLLQQLRLWKSAREDDQGVTISIERGDSRKSLGRKEAFDGLLTSPPYLTRLDYVQATMPELLLLKEFDVVPDMQRLRRSMIGSPLTSDRPNQSLERLPNSIKVLLDAIYNHGSKASTSYYHKFFSTYFIDLQASVKNISKVMKANSRSCIVVQSSHYKEIEIDLAASIIALGEECGLAHEGNVDFVSRRSMSLVNSRAHEEARKPKKETAIFLRKG